MVRIIGRIKAFRLKATCIFRQHQGTVFSALVSLNIRVTLRTCERIPFPWENLLEASLQLGNWAKTARSGAGVAGTTSVVCLD